MTTSALAVRFDNDSLWVDLADGRTISVPLVWFPRLASAAPAELERYELSPSGIHWDDLNEDISIAGLLAGRGDATRARISASA